jgi:hypothetical protein
MSMLKSAKRIRISGHDKVIAAVIRREQLKGVKRPCVMCDQQTLSRMAFEPSRPDEWGQLKGKHRYIIYALCEDCMEAIGPDEAIDRLEELVAEGGLV